MFGRGLVLLRYGGGAASAGGLFQPIVVAVHGQDADVGEPRRPDPALDRAALAVDQFELDQA